MFRPSLYRGDFDITTGAMVLVGGLVTIFPANPDAVYRAIANGTGATVWIALDTDILTNEGQYVIPNGGVYEWFWERHGLIVTLPFYFFSSGPFGTIRTTEMTYRPSPSPLI